MENEENKGLIDKMAFEDQLENFCWFKLLSVHFWSSLIILSLSLSLLDTQSFLENSGIEARRARKQEEGGSKQGGAGIMQLQQDSLQVLICMYDFLDRYGMHGIACGSFLSWHGFFPGVTVFSAQPFHFRIAMVLWSSHVLVQLDYWMDSKLNDVDILILLLFMKKNYFMRCLSSGPNDPSLDYGKDLEVLPHFRAQCFRIGLR